MRWLLVALLGVVVASFCVLGGSVRVAGAAPTVRFVHCSGTAMKLHFHDLRVHGVTCVTGRKVMDLRAAHDAHHGGAANPLGFRCQAVRLSSQLQAWRYTCSKGGRLVRFDVSA